MKSFAIFTVIRDEQREGDSEGKIAAVLSVPGLLYGGHVVSAIRVSHASTLQYVLRIRRIEHTVIRLASLPASASDEADQTVGPILKAPVRTALQIFQRR